VDPKALVAVDSPTLPHGWRTVLGINALVWTLLLAGLCTALEDRTTTWAP